MDALTTNTMTADQFEKYAEANPDRLLELINGEVVEKVPTEEHGIIALAIGSALRAYNKEHSLGHVGVEINHRKPTDEYNVRLPDVSFRKTSEPPIKKGSVLQMPDLAVEIKSPDDKLPAMREKATYYLNNGSQLVWLVYPDKQQVEVCTLEERHVLGIEDTLTGGEVLPGFEVKIADLFS